MNATSTYHLPVRPYSPIDALNRRAAATGSPGYAMATAYARYNGHHVTLSWNSYQQYYVAEYFWGGRVVICRGSFVDCLNAVLAEYARGDLGSSASINPREDDSDAIALCERLLIPSALAIGLRRGECQFAAECEWYTWRHRCAVESVRDVANPGRLLLWFDWDLMQAAESEEDYRAKLRATYGREYH